ncbi:MAG: hypothetical protein RL230_1024 [Pseudomonadota bacterium]|jgi:hypothetical protein
MFGKCPNGSANSTINYLTLNLIEEFFRLILRFAATYDHAYLCGGIAGGKGVQSGNTPPPASPKRPHKWGRGNGIYWDTPLPYS